RSWYDRWPRTNDRRSAWLFVAPAFSSAIGHRPSVTSDSKGLIDVQPARQNWVDGLSGLAGCAGGCALALPLAAVAEDSRTHVKLNKCTHADEDAARVNHPTAWAFAYLEDRLHPPGLLVRHRVFLADVARLVERVASMREGLVHRNRVRLLV